jgi:YebC/PmpR family DNA-binding regulatory protein
MGAQWKHSLRQTANQKKGAVIGKLVKEIIVATKLGGPDPDGNFRLRGALEEARKNSVPRDTIERAVKKGSGQLDDGLTLDTVLYEGFAPHQVPVLVECVTDNRNRTASDIRLLFRKGQLGSTGSVAWMFERKGVVEACLLGKKSGPMLSSIDPEGVAIEAGADAVETYTPENESNGHSPAEGLYLRFITGPSELDSASKFLHAQQWNVLNSELSYIAKNFVELDDDKLKEVGEFLEKIDDNDDVHRIYVALKS